jgi:NitT/TauT family transport system substrate-binding protein
VPEVVRVTLANAPVDMNHRPTRMQWLASGASGVAAAAFPRLARAQNAGPLQVGAGLIEPQAQAYYARANGFFKQRGLDVVVVTSSNGAATTAAVAGGTLQIGVTSVLGLAQAVGRGLPFVTFAPGGIHDSRFPASGLLVLPDSKVAGAKDLSGKVVAVSTLKGLDQLVVSALIDKLGGDVGSVKFVELRPTEGLAALQAGRVDAINLEDPEFTAARSQTRLLGDAEDAVGKIFVETTWFATRDWVTKNADAARKFRDAVVAGGAWAMANPLPAAAVLQQDLKVTTTRATQRFGARFNLADYQVLLDAAAKFKFINPTSAADMVMSL